MKNYQKIRILFVGPENSGKTKIANFLSDNNIELPEDLRPTDSLRILEYDVNGIVINGTKTNIDVELWDTSGNERTMPFWPIFRRNANGIVFILEPNETTNTKQLENMFNYFVTYGNFSLRACLVCFMPSEVHVSQLNLPQSFSKVSQINVNLVANAEKFKQEFNKYVTSVVSTIDN